MDDNFINISKELPFFYCSQDDISQLFTTPKKNLFNRLTNNNFSISMINMVNGFSKDNYTCNYYNSESINQLFKNHHPNSLKAFHLNLESFNTNGDLLKTNLKLLNFEFDILCLTEVRKTSINMIELVFPNYDIFLDTPSLCKGGVAVLVKKNRFSGVTDLNAGSGYDLKNNCNCDNCICENVWVSFNINKQKVLIGGIYRHPKGNIEHFNNSLKDIISNINDNTLAIILGDINVNLMLEGNEKVDTYLNNYFENKFVPCITLPTRIRDHSTTLIDHIFVKNPLKLIQNKCTAGNLTFEISDHLPNFMILNINAPSIKDRPFIRLFSDRRVKNFKENLSSEAPLLHENEAIEINSTYDIFSHNYITLYNKYFPYVKQSIKSFKDKPYITSGIKVSIRHRNKLYNKYLENPNKVNEASWKTFRNKTNQIIIRSREHYYSKILSAQNNNSRNLWKTFGAILNKNKIKHKNISSLNINNENISDKKLISESLNTYFTKIGESLASKFPGNNYDYVQHLGLPAEQSILFYKISPTEIQSTIDKLKDSLSSGPDELHSKFILISSSILVPALEIIFNMSLQSGIYPNKLKIAKVMPIFKKGDSTQPCNYRPISILNTLNKIFEKILHARITKYINDFNILYKYQFGFREGHSTELDLIEIVDNIRYSLDSSNLTCGIYLDLTKAFDTVNHEILMGKLEHYGIRGKAFDLLKSYLDNREQFTKLDNFKSKVNSISCGVPQGSVLGPLLFILFINDLPRCCPMGNVRIFADDTNIFFHGSSIQELINLARIIMTNLNAWFVDNKLTLNTEKSSFIIFRPKRKNFPNLPDHLVYLNFKIKRTSSIKFLGVILDEHLTWDQHINELCTKLKSMFHIFYSIRNYLNKECIKTIYFTLIYSRIKYGISVYGQIGLTKINKIQVLQNKLLKVLAHKKFRYSTNKLHDDFGILKVMDIANQEILTFVYKYFNNNLPSVFQDYFTLFGNENGTVTRNTNFNIRFIERHSMYGEKSVKVVGAKLWNNLHNDVRLATSIKLFKSKLKSAILPYEG